jgi:hypothetical protein
VSGLKDKQMTAEGLFFDITAEGLYTHGIHKIIIQVWMTPVCFIRPTRLLHKAIGKLKHVLIQQQRAI